MIRIVAQGVVSRINAPDVPKRRDGLSAVNVSLRDVALAKAWTPAVSVMDQSAS